MWHWKWPEGYWGKYTSKQGCHFPDNMKFPDFSRPRLSSIVSPRPSRVVWGHAPQENFQNEDLQLSWKWISDNKIPWFFPDFWNSVTDSPTFPGFTGQWQPCLRCLKNAFLKSLLKDDSSNIYFCLSSFCGYTVMNSSNLTCFDNLRLPSFW